MSSRSGKELKVSFDDLGLAVNGTAIGVEATVEDVECAMEAAGARHFFGPSHLAKPTDNYAVVLADCGVEILARIGDSALSEIDCVFDPKEARVGQLEPFSGDFLLFGVPLRARIPRHDFQQIFSRSERTMLDQVVFRTGPWLGYLAVEKRTLSKGAKVRVKRFSVGPSRHAN